MPDSVLGIWDGHDASVALIANGELCFALSEERPTRIKRYSGFPRLALQQVLRFARDNDLRIKETAIAGHHGRAPLRLAEVLYRRTSPARDPRRWPSRWIAGYENLLPAIPGVRTVESHIAQAATQRRLNQAGVFNRTRLVKHHEAHAFSALLLEHNPQDVVLTWDAYGEGICGTYRRAHSPPDVSVTFSPMQSPAALYGAITVSLGFTEGDEGKVMGLAARGDPDHFQKRLQEWMLPDAGGTWRLPRRPNVRDTQQLIEGIPPNDVAAGLQSFVDCWALNQVKMLLLPNRRDCNRLLLSGGLFANIQVNRVLAESGVFGGVAVFPNMTDGGLSAGAAARLWWQNTGEVPRMLSPYLGSEPGVTGQNSTDPALLAAMAADLEKGKVVCVYRGRDEFGPRALLHRSVLFSPTQMALGDRVNSALSRDSFMPFGPVIRQERLREVLASKQDSSDLQTMTLSVKARDGLRESYPVAVHVDNTLRPQVVDGSQTPWLSNLLRLVEERTGWPWIINTSFNLHGEPIVHTPEDALATFRTSGLDVLYLGNQRMEAGDVA